ncbi:MAG TPA: hypothetical protein VKS82_05390 [Streptosporangiaceae bacterium]|nr:hypothetical protein [Streptosporangiaceae bacterium]
MTDTAISIPLDLVSASQRTIGDLAVIATDLLTEASAAGLTLPDLVKLYGNDELELQFTGLPGGFDLMTAWADHFGSRDDITIRLCEFEDGPRIRCGFVFIRHAVTVELYGYAKASPALAG